ncbi:hypothetical protein POPTR_006G019600v4 [Populus trichocarpa]|nr:hypothetical protein BDE02_06G016900 [Populus trichocarpa]KAI9391956.1 hypothetical protein POPTR_006G019600v4 [Populus trichocarpa]
MVIKVVDLGCEKCHKKIKRVLCAIPQIQNQTYDKKENTVTITVVGFCPEKIKKKIYCKGGRTVKCVEIKPPPKPKPEPKPEPKPKPEPCPCCEKCRRGPCCHHYCMPTVPPYCPVPCRRAVCDIWEALLPIWVFVFYAVLSLCSPFGCFLPKCYILSVSKNPSPSIL